MSYGSSSTPSKSSTVRCCQILRAPPVSSAIWPGNFLEVDVPNTFPSDAQLAIELRVDSVCCRSTKTSHAWPQPAILDSVGGKLRFVNPSAEPIFIKKNDHVCQARLITDALTTTSLPPDVPFTATKCSQPQTSTFHSDQVSLDPDGILPPNEQASFITLLKEFDRVFDPRIPGYNGSTGPIQGVVNMGPDQPPQRKGRMPQYARNQLEQSQTKFDELEAIGVLKLPEDLGVVAEYLNPSFLMKKRSGGFRLVSAFTDVGRYSKPQPSLMPDVDSTLRKIACWRYIFVSDLSQSFYQIPLSKNSLKYCGVATPFKGVRE